MNKLISLLFLLLLLSGCSDLLESSYANYDEVVADNAIRRGWIPIFLPKSASNIQEVHNLENNEIWLVFNLKAADFKTMVKSCNSIPLSEIKYPSRAVSWWPDVLSPDKQEPNDIKPEGAEDSSPAKEANNQKENKPSNTKKSSTPKASDASKKRQSGQSKDSKSQKEVDSKKNQPDKNQQDKDKQSQPNQDKQKDQESQTTEKEEVEKEETYQFYQCDRTTQYANSAKKISAYLAVTEDRQKVYYWRPGH